MADRKKPIEVIDDRYAELLMAAAKGLAIASGTFSLAMIAFAGSTLPSDKYLATLSLTTGAATSGTFFLGLITYLSFATGEIFQPRFSSPKRVVNSPRRTFGLLVLGFLLLNAAGAIFFTKSMVYLADQIEAIGSKTPVEEINIDGTTDS